MDNHDIAEGLKLTARLMELHNENPFKVRSISNAAFRLSKSGVDLGSLSEEKISELDGIGKGIASKILEFRKKGTTAELEDLKKRTPEGVIRMLSVKGIGPKKVGVLWRELGVEDIGELLYACRENRLLSLKGFGEKTQAEVRKNIEFMLSAAGNQLYAVVEAMIPAVQKRILKETGAELAEPVGEFRRKMEVITHLEFLIASEKRQQREWEEGGLRISYTSVSTHEFWKEVVLRSSAGEFLGVLPALRNGNSEEDMFSKSGLQFVPPECRENPDAAGWAVKKKVPDLIHWDDLRGCLHNHSRWSDGLNTIEEMALACRDMGLKYFGICDHSKTAAYAGGLSIEQVVQQREEVERLNSKIKAFRIFHGIESDILGDGALDYPDDVLAGFDFVVASIHQNLKMDETKAMTRLIRAIENPYTRILGHPTGRLLLSRPGYPINHKKLIDACAANGVVIELNANPWRLDIDWRWIPYCMEKSVLISINPDAHEIDGILDMKYGINVARKAGLTAASCLNAMEIETFTAWLKTR